jgi:hypothetical protein
MKPGSWNSGARETAIYRQRSRKQAKVPEPSLGNETGSNNGGTVGDGVSCAVCAVFYAFRPEAIGSSSSKVHGLFQTEFLCFWRETVQEKL